MQTIRNNVFETNSSSTHSICICKEERNLNIPNKIEIDIKKYEFGWEYAKRDQTKEKLAYLIIGIVNKSYTEGFEVGCTLLKTLMNYLGEWIDSVHIKGIEIITYNKQTYLDSYYVYVDHASELSELIDVLLNDKEMLKRYLFSIDSFILTGNDNEEGYQDIKVDYEHDEFYKGN